MSSNFKIKIVKFDSGERFPMLIGGDGIPLFDPTVYTISELRGRGLASNSIANTLQSIQLLFIFLEQENINLSERILIGSLFSLGEIDRLSNFCRLTIQTLETKKITQTKSEKVVSLEQIRLKSKPDNLKYVSSAFTGSRMRYMRDYIEWLTLKNIRANCSQKNNLLSELEQFKTSFNARIPKAGRGFLLNEREGLAPSIDSLLFEVISPQSSKNPWHSEFVRQRNELIIHWLYKLGLRRGELLGVKISDIDFQEGTVIIHRRADDKTDPRTIQPQTKTRARKLSLSKEILDATYNFVMNYRGNFETAKKHPFLFCADITGDPLSLMALNKIFTVLRQKCPELPKELTPHVLRHTWNDRFSEKTDKSNLSVEDEKKMRSYLMGWSETSNTAATYTKRHIREKAQKILLTEQEKMVPNDE